jgi:hypothetical protein
MSQPFVDRVPKCYRSAARTRTINHLAPASRGFSLFFPAKGACYIARQVNIVVNQLHALDTPIGGGLRIGFTEAMLPSDKEHMEAITAMSDKLGVSTSDVAAVFRSELDRLTAGARITDFLIVLALGKTRTLLRARSGRVAAH